MGVGAGMGQAWGCWCRMDKGGTVDYAVVFLSLGVFWVAVVVRARRASAGAWAPLLRGPFGLPCGAPADRGLARTRLRLKQSPALTRSPVRSSATQKGRSGPSACPAGAVDCGTLGEPWGAAKNGNRRYKRPDHSTLAAGFSLYLCERAAHIPRGLQAFFTLELPRVFSSVLRSPLLSPPWSSRKPLSVACFPLR